MYTAGEAAKKLGLSKDGMRYYERGAFTTN